MFQNLKNLFGAERVQSADTFKASNDDWDAPTAPATTEAREVPVSSAARTPAATATPVTAATTPPVTRESVATVKFPNAATVYADDSVLDELIPDDLRGCHELLKRLKAMPDRNNGEWRLKWTAKERAVVKKIHELSNAQPLAHSLKRVAGRPASIIGRVKAGCVKEVAELKARCFEFSATREFLNLRGLLPGAAKREIDKVNSQIATAQNADEIQKLVDRKSQLVAVQSSYESQFTATRILNLQFMALKPTMVALEQAVEGLLSKQDAELVQAEKEFFATYGLPHQRTAVSNVVAEARTRIAASVAHYHGAAEQASRMHPSVLVSFDPGVFAELWD